MGATAMTDLETPLVQRAAAGDELAWRRLVHQCGPVLRRVSLSYGLGEADAADAVAAAWSKLVEHIGALRDVSAVRAWLITTLRRECLSRARARKREQPVADFAGVDEPAHVVDFDRALLGVDRRRMVRGALMQLPEPQRQLIAMLFADPPSSYAEISARLAVPIGSIGPTRLRLLAKLREALSGHGPELAFAG